MRTALTVLSLLLITLLLLGIAWWQLVDYRYQSTVDWQVINQSDYVDSKKINDTLENVPLYYDFPKIGASSQYIYQLVIGRYKHQKNALKMQEKLLDIVGEMNIKQDKKGLWVISSAPIKSRTRLDLIKIQLNNLQIFPQQIRKKAP